MMRVRSLRQHSDASMASTWSINDRLGPVKVEAGRGSPRPSSVLDVIDLHAVTAVGAVQQEELRIVRRWTPGVDIGLVELLAAPRALVAELEPLVARDVLAAH